MPQPACYNGNVVIFAHGYSEAGQPLRIPEEQLYLADGTPLVEMLNGLGFGFATTSYSRNGLAVLEGMRDIRDLVDIYKTQNGGVDKVYLLAASEGGLIATRSMETYPGVYSGALAACGPLGSFRDQINYAGDFRVLFDYLFPGVIPGSAVLVPRSVMEGFSTIYVPAILRAVRSNPDRAGELMRVARIPAASENRAHVEEAILTLAWFAIVSTNNTRQRLGGQPFDNIGRWYSGSKDDQLLNRGVQRAAADPAALAAMRKYETSRLLNAPLVALHTTGDPVVPDWHEALYRQKTERTGSSRRHTYLPVARNGHCRFNVSEVLLGMVLMLIQSGEQKAVRNTLLPMLPEQMRSMALDFAK